MRRFWIIGVGVLAVAGVVSAPSVAYARSGTSHQASSCSDLVKKYQKANKATASADFNNPKTLKKVFNQAAQQLKSLSNNGPSELRPSFKRLATAFSNLANLDFSSPDALTQVSGLATTYLNDIEKIATYFSTKCNFKIPSSPSGSIPSVPTS